MGSFEDRLWGDLVRDHATTMEIDRRPQPRGSRRLRRAGSGVAVAAAAVGTTVALLATGTAPPAYAVTTHGHDSITIHLLDANGVSGANAALAKLHAPVLLVPAGAACLVPGVKQHAVATQPLPVVKRADGSITIKTKAGVEVVIGVAAAKGHPGVILRPRQFNGPPPLCVPPGAAPATIRGALSPAEKSASPHPLITPRSKSGACRILLGGKAIRLPAKSQLMMPAKGAERPVMMPAKGAERQVVPPVFLPAKGTPWPARQVRIIAGCLAHRGR